MADSGSHSGPSGQHNTSSTQLKRTADGGVSSSIKRKKVDDDHDASQTRPNLSGIKSFLHGISYQIKLCIFVCLANAKKSLDPTNKFSFKVVAEDLNAGKFDDIVYYFEHEDLKGSLKIQAKHKIGKPIPKISLNDFMTDRDGNNPFALQKYFASFHDQQLQTSDMEGLIICTNADIDEDAKDIWQTVVLDVASSSHTSLDSYISSLFAKTGGKCYQLNNSKLKGGKLYELFRQCTKACRLAKLLVNAIKSKEKITRRIFLFKEYRLAILDIIDKKSISSSGSYGFTKEFLDVSLSNATAGYESFRKEFEEQYQQELRNSNSSKDSSGLENLKLKRLYVATDFFTNSKNDIILPEIFPNDKDDDRKLKKFCERFRLVCDTKSEQKVDQLIIDLWRDLYSGGGQDAVGRRKGCIEESVAIEKLFKTNFDWLMNPFAKPLNSEDIKKDLENITNTLAHIKLKGTSEQLRKKLLGSPFRISPKVLQASELYKQIENEHLVEVEAYDIQFGASLVTDLLDMQGKDLHNILLLAESDFTNDPESVREVICSTEHPIYIIVICNVEFKVVQSIVRRWNMVVLNEVTKQVILIKKTSESSSDIGTFCICDVAENSWKQFRDVNIPLCTTTISPAKLLHHSFESISIEEFIKQLNLGKEMEDSNEIVKYYRQIESFYVQRYWIDHILEVKAENLERFDRDEIMKIIRDLRTHQEENFSFKEITKRIKEGFSFESIFPEENILEYDHEPILGEKTKKVLILLGEAGYGKSTNLTWLARHLRKRNRSSWIVRCNLSDHCTYFKPYLESSRNQDGMVIDENEALKVLYGLIHLSIVEIIRADLQSMRLNARKCSECLVLSNRQAILDEKLMKSHGLSLSNWIQLVVFIEKFNAGELVLLMDGFDEIAPHYKEVVMQFLSLFAQFDGVSRLYLTSRPYSFKEQFKEAFKESMQFQLKPLTLQDKATILHKIMNLKMNNEHIDNDTSDFYKGLCVMLIFRLADMSDVPLNLMMSVDILMRLADRCINFSSKTVSIKLFEVTEELSKPSFIVENFVRIKIQLIYSKIGAKPDASDNPILIDEHAKRLERAKRYHGLVALWVFFSKSELHMILSESEICKAKDCMNEIHEAREKTGLINGILGEVPMFIHRTFAEYLAAWWIVNRQMKGKQQGKTKICNLETFWKIKELRMHVDKILAKNYPLHLAIIEHDSKTIDSLTSTDPKAFSERDNGNRTPLHLFACYSSSYRYANLSLKSIDSDIINGKEKVFGWTALDCAFHVHFHLLRGNTNHYNFLYYLLHLDASINVDVLYEQVVCYGEVRVRLAASYANIIMEFLSRKAIKYESHNATKSIKEFCDKVSAYLINEMPTNFRGTLNPRSIEADENNELTAKQTFIFQEIIEGDSVWMLESVTQQAADPEGINLKIRSSFFNMALKEKRVFVLKYFLENNPSLLTEAIFRQCIAMSVIGDYKIEFKVFIDLYCCRMGIIDFRPSDNFDGLIQKDNKFIPFFKESYDVREHCLTIFQINDLIIDNLKTTSFSIPSEIVIYKSILSVLIICMFSTRSLMLRYVKESCKLNVCASIVYYLARVTDYCSKELPTNRNVSYNQKKYEKLDPKLKRLKSAYECLLDQASNISHVEVNGMLRLAITSELFSFSKYLIERYNIGLQTVDELNGWNVLHLCISRPRYHNNNVDKSIFEFFRCMYDERDVDCFEIVGNNGRSILHLAIENGHENIVDYIVARKLGLKQLREIESLGVDAIPNLTFCFRAIHEVSKSVGEKGCYHMVHCMLAKQIANISQTVHDKSIQQLNSHRLLLEEGAEQLYDIAMKCSSLSLMHYLHREFRCKNRPSIDDADWLAWVEKSLKSPDLRMFQWIVGQYCAACDIMSPTEDIVNERIACDVVKEFVSDRYEQKKINLEKLVKQTEVRLLGYQSKEQICIMKLVVLAVCLKQKSAIGYLCDIFSINIDQVITLDIMEIAHHALIHGCTFDNPNFEPIFKYLFERSSNFHDVDAEGRNMLHLAGELGPNCMLKCLFEHNMTKATKVNEQNGWSFFHYYASRMPKTATNDFCYNAQRHIFRGILERVLKNETFTIDGTVTQSREIKIKEICFNSNDGEKSVIHVAFEAGNMNIVEYTIQQRLGIDNIDEHNILIIEECLIFKECYDVLDQVSASRSSYVEFEEILDKIAKPIDNFSLKNIQHATKQANVDEEVVEETCRAAMKYRSVLTLEYLITAYTPQMNRVLVQSSNRELLTCMMECIRRNRISLFRMLLGRYCIVQGIQPIVDVEYQKEENDSEFEVTLKQCSIKWSVIDEATQDVPTKREYLILLVLSFAYGRLSMTKLLIQMLQLVVNRQLILLLMKASHITYSCEQRVLLYEYLSAMSEGKTYLLHLSAQVADLMMVRYLLKHKIQDPCEIDPENGWNTAHYCVSEPKCEANWRGICFLFEYVMAESNIDCLGVHDLCGRSVLHLAMENGHSKIVEYIIKQRLAIPQETEIGKAWNLEKINECIDEMQRRKAFIPGSRNMLDVLQQLIDRKKFLMSFPQAFHSFPLYTN